LVSDNDGLGEEAQRGFAAADDQLDAYTGLYRLVLLTYGYRCALTGAQFAPPVLTLHADLEVEAIQPREEGGPLSINNYLPMISALARPFREGLVTLGDDYSIIVPNTGLLDADLVAALQTELTLPEEPFRPGRAFVGHHRRYALGR